MGFTTCAVVLVALLALGHTKAKAAEISASSLEFSAPNKSNASDVWLYYGAPFTPHWRRYYFKRIKLSPNGTTIDAPEDLTYSFERPLKGIEVLQYDCKTNNIFFVGLNNYNSQIIREDVQRTNATIVYTTGEVITQSALDPINRRLYWIEGRHKIMVANLDTYPLNPTIIRDNPSPAPDAVGIQYLAVHPKSRILFWIELFNPGDGAIYANSAKIWWSGARGESAEIYSSNVHVPLYYASYATLFLNFRSNELCYTQALEITCINLGTKKQRKLPTSLSMRHYTVVSALYGDKLLLLTGMERSRTMIFSKSLETFEEMEILRDTENEEIARAIAVAKPGCTEFM